MATGLKQQNIITQDGESWEDVYAIDAGGLTNADRTNFFVEIKTGANGAARYVHATYIGTGALTIAEFDAFDIGSQIVQVAITTPVISVKKAATTWVTI